MADAGMTAEAIRAALLLVDSRGLVRSDREDLDDAKRALAVPFATASALGLGTGDLATTVERYRPTVMVGTTGVAGTFSEEVVRAIAAGTERPVIMPLSNPTAVAEARPAEVHAWTEGRAIVATGSPFPAVGGRPIGQANNVFIFPGLGLGAIVSQAGRISDAMVLAAARTLAGEVSAGRLQDGALYPPISDLRSVSRAITLAVAREAIRSGLASPVEDLEAEVDAAMWWPAYAPYVRA